MIIGIDAPILIHQSFGIRLAYDRPLTNNKGQVTNHISVLYYRMIELMEKTGHKYVFIFDGKRPDIKKKRVKGKKELRITNDIIDSATKLIELFGFPVVISPLEADCQGAYMVKKGMIDAFATKDIDDAFAFGCPLCINSKLHGDIDSEPHITLEEWIQNFGFETLEQYREWFILVGNDYIDKALGKGKGKKYAQKLIQKHKTIDVVLEHEPLTIDFDLLKKVRSYLKVPKVNKDVSLKFRQPDLDGIFRFMVDDNDFNMKKILNNNKRLKNVMLKGRQKNLMSFV